MLFRQKFEILVQTENPKKGVFRQCPLGHMSGVLFSVNSAPTVFHHVILFWGGFLLIHSL